MDRRALHSSEIEKMNIFGIPIHDASISKSLGELDVIYVPRRYSFGFEPIGYRKREETAITLSCEIREAHLEALVWYTRCPATFFGLGPTVICQHCGFEAKPGLLTCHRYGSVMRSEVERSKYTKAGTLFFSGLTTRSTLFPSDDELFVSVELSIRLEEDSLDFRGLFTNSWQTLSCSGDWICAYCHCVNYKADVDCRFCSAGRLPFSNLKELASNCLYCGRPLRGATVCEACSSAKNGYAVWPAIYRM